MSRRPHRSVTKRQNRAVRGLRRVLVHDAGCVHEGCRYHVASFAMGDLTYIPVWISRIGGRSVAVPRSLQRWLGKRIQ
jgi:hypothetical protein